MLLSQIIIKIFDRTLPIATRLHVPVSTLILLSLTLSSVSASFTTPQLAFQSSSSIFHQSTSSLAKNTRSKVLQLLHPTAIHTIRQRAIIPTKRRTASILFSTTKSKSKLDNQDRIIMKIPLDTLTNFANSFAAANGLQVETKQQQLSSSDSKSSSSSSSYQCAPISLLPNIFPAQSFMTAKSLAPHFNLLVDRISRNGKFLNDTLAGSGGGDCESSVISKDAYTRKLLQLYNEIYMGQEMKEGEGGGDKPNFANLADRLGIQRSDYMLNPSSTQSGLFELKQVELNTIAASFAGLATNVAKLHSILTNRYKQELDAWMDMNAKKVMGNDYECNQEGDTDFGVPHNPALVRLAFAMKVAHERYLNRFVIGDGNGDESNDEETTSQPPAAVLFIVQDGETNTVDQRKLEFQLWEEHGIPVVRMSLTTAHTQLKLDPKNGSLYILKNKNDDDGDEIEKIQYQASLVYYRAGYAPTDYPDGDDGIEWTARDKIERSKATKCPSLGYHLSGTKKVQQELARPGVLEQFFNDNNNDSEKMIQGMRGAFAGLYSLGDDAVEEDLAAVKDAISGSEGKYVLKPQREGGGYNFYGKDLVDKIKQNLKEYEEDGDDGSSGKLVLGENLAEFILMQRLFPPKQTAVLLRAGMVEGKGESISELGCFGTILQSFDGETTLHNEYSGFLLRTKFENVDEGGVASGFATLSSPFLC